jgi:hypothetical protein
MWPRKSLVSSEQVFKRRRDHAALNQALAPFYTFIEQNLNKESRSSNGGLEVRFWYASVLAAGAEPHAYIAMSVFVIEMFAGLMICIVLVREYDKDLWSRFRRRSSWGRRSE